MPEGDLLTLLFNSIDGFIGLGIAVWIIREGMSRMDNMQSQHESFTNSVLAQQQANNDQLMGLVSTLCAQPVQPVIQQVSKNPPKS